jgi:hypothetical protein
MLKSYVIKRSQEGSTYAGLILLVGSTLGLGLDADHMNQIVQASLALAGVAKIFLPDSMGGGEK